MRTSAATLLARPFNRPINIYTVRLPCTLVLGNLCNLTKRHLSNMAWRRTTSALLLLLFAGCAMSDDTFPPAISSILLNNRKPSSLIVPSAAGVTIRCQSEGGTPIWWSVPAPALQFVKPEGITMPSDRITSIGDDYNGDYSCYTNNTWGIAYSSPIKLRMGVVTAPAVGSVSEESLTVQAGTTVVLTCRKPESTNVRPGSLDLELPYVWYWKLKALPGQISFNRIDFKEMYPLTQRRIAIDESSRLYIRNIQPSDFNSSLYDLIGCRSAEGAYASFETDFRRYTLNVASGLPSPVQGPTLVYNTSSVTVIEGGNFTLACIFNDVNDATLSNVNWNNPFYLSFENGARITVMNAGPHHTGTWECDYKGVKGKIDVKVQLYPRLSGIKDTFASSGDTVTLTCNYQSASSISWYKNDQLLSPDFITTLSNTSQMVKFQKVSKKDTGVYACVGTNEVATIRLNGRLIITDPTFGNVSVNDGGNSVGTQAIVDANTTSIRLSCTFTTDPAISNPSIVWRMQQLQVDIDETTELPLYGLSRGSVITLAATKQSSMSISVYGDSVSNIYGNVSCILKYKILTTDFRVASVNSVEIVARKVLPGSIIIVTAQFPYWIIGVIIAALFLILLVFLIIFCVQRNKGEQYYVDEKERKAGHDPKEELPPWQEFNRPDQDPVKGSRASLEMEGDRPMGSDAGSMDEYGVDTDTGKFNEDGSFIGQYGPKGQRAGASGQV